MMPTTEPIFDVVCDGPPSKAAISTMAKVLLAAVDAEEDNSGQGGDEPDEIETPLFQGAGGD